MTHDPLFPRPAALDAVRRLLDHVPSDEYEARGLLPVARWVARDAGEDLGEGYHVGVLRAVAAWVVQRRAIRDLAVAAAADGLAVVFLKGTDLNLRVYPEPGFRPMVDVDVLVAPSERKRAQALLDRLGFARAPLPGDPAVDRAYEWRYLRAADDVLVDLHLHLDWPETLAVSSEDLIAGRQALGVDEIHVLDPVDLVVHLAIHLVKDVRDADVHTLVDAVLALDRFDVAFGDLVDRARAWAARPALYVLLARLQRYAGLDVPEDVLRQLEVGVVARRAARKAGAWLEPPPWLEREGTERALRLALVESWGRRRQWIARYARLRWGREDA